MELPAIIERLSKKVPLGALAAVALLLWVGAHALRLRLKKEALDCRRQVEALSARRETVEEAAAELSSLEELKAKDLSNFKKGLAKLTRSKREVYEAGLALQEEKRLLEKQLELMTTYLMLDAASGRLHRMRGEESLESFPVSPEGGRGLGGAKPPPALTQVVSKERYAHPERGSFSEQDGKLQWNPPQVGASARSNALGEFVVFTRGSLVLHGPPAKAADHEAFPHHCLGLSKAAARRVYTGSSIGTKILLK